MTTTTTPTSFAQLRDAVQTEAHRRMPDHIARLSLSADQVRERQRDGLRALLGHAVVHSPFHARRLSGIDPSRFELADLGTLPVMTKSEMMREFDDVVTDRRLGRAVVESALAATCEEPQPLFGEYVCMASGGSSGERGRFVFDRHALIEFFCSLRRPLMRRLAELGGPPPGGLTAALVAAASAVHATGVAPAITAGAAVRFEGVPATLPLDEIVRRLNALQPPMLLGYPTVLARLASEQQAGRLHISPMSVSATSETLLPEHREVISAGFGVPIINTFGSTEGLVGASAPDAEELVFNTDICIVELVDERNAPVPPGTPSAKVLLTNLSNRAQPLIRYELTDRFVEQPPAPDHGHLRATVEGRADEVLRFGDVDIHPLVIRQVLVKTPEAIEYQVRQTATGIDVAVVVAGRLDVGGLEGKLNAALANAGVPGAHVAVDVVPQLDRHGETGKFRRFIPA